MHGEGRHTRQRVQRCEPESHCTKECTEAPSIEDSILLERHCPRHYGEPMNNSAQRLSAFTLIELSIVLVIIGLLVGGVLVGRDLLSAAAIRAQISQIEKYQQAVNTFKGKYGYLPGDIPNPDAGRFGFATRGATVGKGDGNGIIQGEGGFSVLQRSGETSVFWVDLSAAQLIEGGFSTASPTAIPSADITGTAIDGWFPQGKIGNGNYVFVFSNNATNYFSLEPVTKILVTTAGGIGVYTGRGLKVRQAYSIDNKIDDGLPETGNVLAQYVSTATVFVQVDVGPPNYPAVPQSGTSNCYDNTSPSNSGGNAGQPTAYSLGQSGAWQNFSELVNCTMTFTFQ